MTEAGAGLLPRPRLLSLLAESPARMVLLKAPPGFGKTALLQSYAAQRREAVVWVNCQQADNDPMCLANNLGRALLQQRLISPQALERQFNGFGIPSPELITDALLTLLQQPAPLTLVFNDIDQLLSPPSISLVARLLEECPPQARFFFSCKRSPQLPHSTYLLDQRMLLIGPEELAFTTDEAQQLLLQRAGFSADTAQLQQSVDWSCWNAPLPRCATTSAECLRVLPSGWRAGISQASTKMPANITLRLLLPIWCMAFAASVFPISSRRGARCWRRSAITTPTAARMARRGRARFWPSTMPSRARTTRRAA